MDNEEEEQKKQEEEKKDAKDKSSEQAPAGEEGKELSQLEEAKAINKKKEELLEREEKLTERKEKLEAIRMVGGVTEAGQPQIKETEEDKLKTQAKDYFKGTALGEAIEKT